MSVTVEPSSWVNKSHRACGKRCLGDLEHLTFIRNLGTAAAEEGENHGKKGQGNRRSEQWILLNCKPELRTAIGTREENQLLFQGEKEADTLLTHWNIYPGLEKPFQSGRQSFAARISWPLSIAVALLLFLWWDICVQLTEYGGFLKPCKIPALGFPGRSGRGIYSSSCPVWTLWGELVTPRAVGNLLVLIQGLLLEMCFPLCAWTESGTVWSLHNTCFHYSSRNLKHNLGIAFLVTGACRTVVTWTWKLCLLLWFLLLSFWVLCSWWHPKLHPLPINRFIITRFHYSS